MNEPETSVITTFWALSAGAIGYSCRWQAGADSITTAPRMIALLFFLLTIVKV